MEFDEKTYPVPESQLQAPVFRRVVSDNETTCEICGEKHINPQIIVLQIKDKKHIFCVMCLYVLKNIIDDILD